MDKGKLKNIIIIVLLLVNLVFGIICIVNSVEKKLYISEVENSMVDALASSGITLTDKSVLKLNVVPVYSCTRDLSNEKSGIATIIGQTNVENLGGNVMMYKGKDGQACFRGTGDFEVLMENNTIKLNDKPVAQAVSIMKKLGTSVNPDTAVVNRDGNSGACEVGVLCTVNDYDIVNCRVDFTFSGQSLLLITGTRPLSTISERNDIETLDASTVIMRFLELLKNNGYVCKEINNIDYCYKFDVTSGDEGTLIPLWHFSTDIGDFYINGTTGKEEATIQNN